MDCSTGEIVEINMTVFPLTSLGPGTRAGIWFQGCSRRCIGCISPHTWERGHGEKVQTDEAAEKIIKYTAEGAEGITISGGEPFEQYGALIRLIKILRENGIEDILIYTGFTFEEIKKSYGKVLEYAAVIIDGRFIAGALTDKVWKGSENQNMYILTKNEKIRERYKKFMMKDGKRKMQVSEKEGKLIIIGIPKQNDLEELKNGI